MLQAQYIPIPIGLYVLFLGIVVGLIFLVQIGLLSRAYEALGLGPSGVTLALFGSLIGSYVNIPIAHLPGRRIIANGVVDYFGIPLIAPIETDYPGTILAVNVGGAVIPTLLSLYLLGRRDLWLPGAAATAIVAFVVHRLAQPVPGIGISVPLIVPPLLAAFVAVLLSRRQAAPLAYVGGSLGVLIGADLLNLGKLQSLGASVASIGGAGTFDGVFLAGVAAVLLTTLGGAGRPARV